MKKNQKKNKMKSQLPTKSNLSKESHSKIKENPNRANPTTKTKANHTTKTKSKVDIIKVVIKVVITKVGNQTGIISIKATKEESHSLIKVAIISSTEESLSTKTSTKSIDTSPCMYISTFSYNNITFTFISKSFTVLFS